jgi:hypothetical protein
MSYLGGVNLEGVGIAVGVGWGLELLFELMTQAPLSKLNLSALTDAKD